ncbi:MAG TPA: hypothetical protein VFB01_08395 [Burkholderiales bacterium]|nr:hypothetical protein [Burkholderiales bacterium]
MVSRERFAGPVAGIACPLCLSRSHAVVTRRDPMRGLMQTIYRCEDCKSYFGDPSEAADAKPAEPSSE